MNICASLQNCDMMQMALINLKMSGSLAAQEHQESFYKQNVKKNVLIVNNYGAAAKTCWKHLENINLLFRAVRTEIPNFQIIRGNFPREN
jgi:hypothetical protein